MLVINRVLNTIQKTIRFISSLIIFLMMIFIFLNVILRLFNISLIGNVEIVKLMMVVIIMFGMAYCEYEKFHIAVEIFYEKFPKPIQTILLVFSYLLGAVVTVVISIIYFNIAIHTFEAGLRKTELLKIPLYPFEFIIAISFLIWFLQIIVNLINIRKGNKRAD